MFTDTGAPSGLGTTDTYQRLSWLIERIESRPQLQSPIACELSYNQGTTCAKLVLGLPLCAILGSGPSRNTGTH